MSDTTTTDDGKQSVDVSALQAELDKEREKRRNFEAKVTNFEKVYKGVDPERYRALEEEVNNLKNDNAAGDPKKMEDRIKTIKEELTNRFAGDIEEKNKTIGSLNGKIKELTVDSKVFSDAVGHFLPDFHPDLKRYIRENCDLNDEGTIIIKDEKGELRYSPTNKAKLMTHSEYIEELKSQKSFAVVDKSVAGGKQSGQKYTNGGAKISSLSQLAGLPGDKQREVMAAMDPKELAELVARGVNG